METAMRKPRVIVALACLASLALGSAASGRMPQVHALKDVRIVVAPGQEIASGTVVLRDGIIVAVGEGVEAPADARLWEWEEAVTVYPGLIESYAVRPWPEPEEEDAAPQGGHANALVTPQRDMGLHAYDEGAVRKLREAGFTSAVVAPEQGLFRGRGVLINLGDGPLHDELLRRDVASYVSPGATSDDGYPGSLMGSVALFRQTLHDARWYAAAHAAYEANPVQERPAYNSALAALAEAAGGEAPWVFDSSDLLETLRVAALAEEFGLDATVVGHGEEYQRLEDVAATGLPHLLPLAFPDDPTVGEEDPLRLELEELRHWDLAPENPARLLAAGVTVALTSHGLAEPKQLHARLATALERGLTGDQALAALTTTPAEMLGVGDRLGTVEAGKIANLVVVEGELFVDGPKVREVWIDGRHIEVKESKPPEVDPEGTWSLIIDAGPGGKIPVTLVLSGEVSNLSGTIGAQGGQLPLTSAEVSGKAVEISFDSTPFGMPGTISFKLQIDGETATGKGISPRGPFSLTGKRTEKPEPEVMR